MPFDPSTARPVTAPAGKFDVSTAKPVEAQEDAAPPEQSLADRYKDSALSWLSPAGAMETVAQLGSNIVAAPVAGLAGAGAALTNAVGLTHTPAADVVNNVAGGLTYQPKTRAGKAISGVVNKPFEWLARGADSAGDVTGGAVPALPVKDQSAVGYSPGSGGWPMQGRVENPLVAATTNTAIQFLPALLLKGKGGRVAVEREIPATADASAGAEAAKVAPQEAVARDYVARNTSLDWNAIPGAIKARLVEIASKSGDLSSLDPKALERQAQLGSLRVPVPATRGILERDPVQLRNEGNVSATDAGKPIRDIHLAANNALLQNLEVLKGRTRGRADSPEQVGTSVQDTALRAKAEKSKANYNELYKKAREIEPDARASVAPITDLLTQNPEIQHLGWVQTWLNKAAKLAGGKEGEPVAITDATLAELDDLRKLAGKNAASPGDKGFYAKQVSESIDQAMNDVPAAAKAWGAARDAFKKHKTEFSEQGAVERLVTDKSRTDRSTALEDTWRKTVIGGSIEDLQKVKRSLLTGGDQATRAAGKQAWRDMRAQTIQHITDEATKSVTRFEDGSPNITPASMERAIRSIGKNKLDEIFGPGTVRDINKIMEATRLVKTEPPAIHKGASTASNILALLSSKLDKVPVLGAPTVGTIKMIGSLKEIGESGRIVREAQSTQLDNAKAKKQPDALSTKEKIAVAIAAQGQR